MTIQDAPCDTRMYLLLHALGDKEEVISEAIRLLLETDMNEKSWQQIRDMGLEIAPEHSLFNCAKTFHQLRREFAECDRVQQTTVDYPKNNRRIVQRLLVSDRRSYERRGIRLPWLGVERRKGERRHFECELT